MTAGRFPALMVEARGEPAHFVELGVEDLPAGEVLVEVIRSSLNYKDGLAVTGSSPVARTYPMVCGIDLAGRVLESADPRVEVGALVAMTGHGLSETRFGGYAGRARVPAEWCVPLPGAIDPDRAMAIGTAGVTAMLAVLALERNGSSAAELGALDLPLLVTGAVGGVGSLAVALGARLGYRVVASTGRSNEAGYLRHLGAAEVIDRSLLVEGPDRPLEKERFGAAIDVVGGVTLSRVLAATRTHGAVAVCGLAGGAELVTTVHPLILRGVTVAGISSGTIPADLQARVWERLSGDLPLDLLDEMTVRAPLAEVPLLAVEILAGRVRGRMVVEVA